jgi:hypothetical protein
MAACSQFIFTENLVGTATAKSPDEPVAPVSSGRKSGKEMRQDSWLVHVLRNAVEQTMDDYGWANLSEVGQYINNSTSFSPINYGYKKLSSLIKEIDLFDIAYDDVRKQMSIRDKRWKSSE